MIIKNYKNLATNPRIETALEILEAGLDAALPENGLDSIIDTNQIQIDKKIWDTTKYENVSIVAFGKAANSMAKFVNSKIDIKNGFIVAPDGIKDAIKSKKFQIFYAGHPLPNQTSVKAAKTIMSFLEKTKENDFVIFLVSGGGSSLLTLPNGITLSDKSFTTDVLINSGATIQEINCVRKHLSQIKGGKLIQSLKCDGIALVMSDVMDDDLSSIASGTTYYDDTTFADAISIIQKYGLESTIPQEVLDKLRQGVDGEISDTPKTSKIPNYIVATNDDCLKSMERKSKQLGLTPKIIKISGDVKKIAPEIVEQISQTKNSCLIFGGEATVNVIGEGSGGRNQELVLRLLKNLQKINQNFIISSMGTDGIDGNTTFAGALIEKKQHLVLMKLKNF